MKEPQVNKEEIKVMFHFPFSIDPIEGKQAEVTMERGCNIMEKLHLYHWITSGNLLGIYRDRKLIDHDTDIDVCCLFDYNDPSLYDKAIEIVKAFSHDNFALCMTQVLHNRPQQFAFIDLKNNKVIFDIYFYYSGFGENLLNWNMEGILRKPERFIETLGKVEFKNKVYRTPSPIADFLAWRYGEDWHIPKKKKDNWVSDAKHIKPWL